jgi:putative ABC transport system permease protein
MDTLLLDSRHACRRLMHAPGLTLAAVLTLGLGLGGNGAVLSAVEALLLRPLPYPDPARLVLVQQTDAANRARAVAPANFADWRTRSSSFESLAAYEVVGRTLLGSETPVRVSAGIVSGSFFEVLGVRPALGRAFGPRAEGTREAVLGHGLWQEHLGGNPSVVGRDLQLDGELVRVLGVMPPGFAHPPDAELWLRARHDLPEIPIAVAVDPRTVRDSRYLDVVGRLRPGGSLDAARAEMDGIAAALAVEYPEANAQNGARVTPLFEELRGPARPALALLLGAAGCVLLVACANVANLLLARAVGRRHELSVRAALGASGARLSRELLTEALLLAVLGGAAGLALARAVRPLLQVLWPASLPPLEGLRLSGPVLVGSGALALLAVVLVGLLPARHAARADALEGLRGEGRAPLAGPGAHRARAAFVVAEVALAVVLVSAAGLLGKSLLLLQTASLGFEPDGALSARVSLPRSFGQEPLTTRTLAVALEERLRVLPGVTAAGVGQALPLTGLRTSANLRVEGREVEPSAQPDVAWRVATPAYFQALGVRLLRGRSFDHRDRAGTPQVALVNATFARQVFGDEDPVGRRVGTGLDGPSGTWVTIVGVVGDTPQENVAKAVHPEMYRPLAQDYRMAPASLAVVLRTAGDPAALAPALRREVAAARSDLAVSEVQSLTSLARESIAGPRAAAQVLGLFAGLALSLAALGLYGVMSCLVGERRHEVGVRLALGARPSAVVSMVLGRSLAFAGLGLGLGLAAALVLGRLLEGVLFGVRSHDPATLALVSLVLLLVAAAAAYAPARRASRLDPAVVLRTE